MSNFPDAHKVYDLAAVFRERVIEQGRSFLWPDQKVWTPEKIDEVLFWMIKEHEDGALTLQTFPDRVMREPVYFSLICADMVAIRALPGPVKGVREVVRRVNALSTSDPLLLRDTSTWHAWVETLPLGLSSSSFGWKGHWIEGLIGSINTIRAVIRARGFEEFSQQEIWDALQAVSIPECPHAQWFAWELLEVLYPKELPFALHQDFKKIIGAFAHLGFKYDTSANFETLRSIREHLSPGVDPHAFSFYSPEIRPLWVSQTRNAATDSSILSQGDRSKDLGSFDSANSISHIVDECAPIYEVVELFSERAVVGGRSLLWPELEVWTEEVITRFLQDFGNNEAQKGQSWLESFRHQVEKSDPRTARLLADSYAFLMQFPSTNDFKGATKFNTLEEILGWIDEAPDVFTLEKINRGFGIGIGSAGPAFAAAMPHQVAYVPLFVRLLAADPGKSYQRAADDAVIKAKSDFGFKKTTVPARNIVLHLLEPALYERIASRSHKVQIVDSLTAQLEQLVIDNHEDLDAQIRVVRKHLAGSYFAPNFDFYDDNVSPYWLGNDVLTDREGEKSTRKPPLSIPTITDLATATHLDQSFLSEIEALLRNKKQLIFEGPPGSGKTFVAEKFARYITGQPLDGSRNEQVELIQFHQSYSYEDFVEGIRPRTNDAGQLIYDVEPGIFRTFAERAQANPDKKFVLIIDEINRGNVSRILGELMLLLEYRDQTATLPYSKQPLTIPKNLYIIGTMNSADRSLSQIDYALRRRFYFVRFMSVEHGQADVLRGWLQARDVAHAAPVALFVRLNERIREHMHTDDLQVGHSYFMRTDIGNPKVLDQVWKYSVMPLLREYFYHQKDREELLDGFELNRLSGLPDVPVTSPEAIDVADV